MNDRSQSRRGFTLIELLVVIGVIVILAALLIPMVIRSMRQSGKMRIQADFQSIAVALDAYKTDFGDIPRVDPAFPDTGAAVLGKALLGRYGDGTKLSGNSVVRDDTDPIQYAADRPYEAGDVVWYSNEDWLTLAPVTGVAPNAAGDRWARFDANDGADGPGFRVRAGQGKVWGPYVDTAKVNNRGTYLLDHYGGAIQYFPTRPGRTNVTDSGAGYHVYVGRDTRSYINANDNFKIFRRLPEESGDNVFPLKRLQIMLGDTNANGYIDSGEKAIDQPYVLISPGSNGIYGPAGYQPPTSSPLTTAQVEEAKKLLERDDDVLNVQ